MSGIVLCALDISQPDRERPVLRRAAQIAALDGARLDVITVVPDMAGPMIGAYFSPELHDRIIADAQQAPEPPYQFTEIHLHYIATGRDLDPAVLNTIATEIGLADTIQAARDLIDGKVRGRLIVDVNR